jgi:hypothetical protein
VRPGEAPERQGRSLPRRGVRESVNGLTDVNDMWSVRLRRGTTELALAAHGDGVGLIADTATALGRAGVGVLDLGLRRPTLDDVFLELTDRARGTADDGHLDAAADGGDEDGRDDGAGGDVDTEMEVAR